MKRFLIFIHYNPKSSLDKYVIFWLKELRKVFEHIHIVSNSPLSSLHLNKIADLYDQYTERENVGFDFAATRDVLFSLDRNILDEFDWLTVMNDTCFGPLFSLENVLKKMEASGADFWSMTDHQDYYEEQGNKLEFYPYHLQSYFLSFNKTVFTDSSFWNFWKNIQDTNSVHDVVRRYEIGLTQTLLRAGFQADALVNTSKQQVNNPNLTIHNRLELFNKELPTIKIKSYLFKEWYSNFNINSLIKNNSDYPFELIDDYFKKHDLPHTYAKKVDKYLPQYSVYCLSNSPNFAFHIHLYYPEVFSKLIKKLKSDIKIPADVYISVRPELDISGLIPEDTGFLNIKSIERIPNIGRDIFPWFALAPVLAKYDMVCHIHTKSSPTEDEIGSLWNDFLYDSLCSNYNLILNEFLNFPDLGIVIPDIPHCWKMRLICNSPKILGYMKKIWSEISLNPFTPDNFKTGMLFPLGTMCWYRPKALEKLFNFSFNEEDIMEPLPGESILHAIERILVYAAWENSYDFRIVQTSAYNFMDKSMSLSTPPPRVYFSEYKKLFAKRRFYLRYQPSK